MHYSPMNRQKRGATWPSVSVHPAPCPLPVAVPSPGATGTATCSGRRRGTRRGASMGAPCVFFYLNTLPNLPFGPKQPAFRP
jgi:hypothetical protein